jgi:hypothetical protein
MLATSNNGPLTLAASAFTKSRYVRSCSLGLGHGRRGLSDFWPSVQLNRVDVTLVISRGDSGRAEADWVIENPLAP